MSFYLDRRKSINNFFHTFLLFFLFTSTQAQEFSYGIKAGYFHTQRLYNKAVIEGTIIEGRSKSKWATGNAIDGLKFAALSRFEYKKWYLQGELAYSVEAGGNGTSYVVDNWGNPNNTDTPDYWLVGISTGLKNFELGLSGGYKVRKWLRFYIGLNTWYVRVRDPKSLELVNENTEGLESVARNYNKRLKFAYAIQESYSKWVLMRQIGIGVDIKRNFSLDLVYEQSLTPVGKSLVYNDKSYFFKQSASRFTFSIGYRLYKIKLSKNQQF